MGIRLLDPDTAELRRLFVQADARRSGVGSRLLAAAEEASRRLGARRVRLGVRGDLVEARALYSRWGYAEIEDYNGDRFVDHWFEKPLD